MSHSAMQNVLQTGLASGLSATSGFHSSKPTYVDASKNDLSAVLPQSFVPNPDARFKIRAKGGDLEASYISIGAWSWGDTATWHWKPEELQGVKEAWKILHAGGVNYIDTAQAYGSGRSEEICGELVAGMPRESYIMQTKYYVVPDNVTNIVKPTQAPVVFLKESLERMKLAFVDVYMVHGHIHAGSIKQVAKGMAECVEQGLAKAIAVANYSKEDMLQMKDELAKYDIPLAINQVEFNLLRRLPELDGLLKACNENGIQLQSYSSLAQARLGGKYNVENQPPKTYRFSSYAMEDIKPTTDVVKKIADKRGKSEAAIALNYNIGKNVIPVVGIRNVEQAKSNMEALGWRLTEEEYKELDAVSVEGKYTKLWQQG